MLKSIIVDDEIASIETLEILLRSIDTKVHIVGKADNINDAKTIIQEKKPDLVFLDIEMPQGSGFDLLDRIENIDFHVIFITAFNEYAIKAFKYSAIDYILKPIDIKSLNDAIQRVKQINENNINGKMPLLKQNLEIDTPEKLALTTYESIEIVSTEDVIQFEADGNYTTVHLKNRSPIIVSKSLGEYEEILKDDSFYRCHKSHLINLRNIRKVIKSQNQIIMSDDTNAFISRRRKQDFLDVIHKYLKN
jgi:two-component system LytT family response regulator